MHVPRLFRLLILGVACLGFAAFGWFRWTAAPATATAQASHGESGSTVVRGTFVRALRLNGLIEAVESVTVLTPRLAGGGQPLIITKIAPKGSHVSKGDLVIEFDRQQQLRNALDRKADWQDLEEQIKRKRADLVAQDAKDATALKKAESDLTLARLDLLKNDMIPRIEAEKNQLSLEAAEATVKQLRKTLALKRVSAVDDIRILEVRRDRLAIVVRQAEQNADRMSVRSPIDGLVVYRQLWRNGGQMGDPQEGLEMWPGSALIDVVGSKAMRVRAKVNQADVNQLKTGLLASVRLDAYPARTYRARLDQLSPVAVSSNFSNKVRAFTAVFTIDDADAALTPDLSAAVDVELERREGTLLAPLDAIAYKNGKPFLRVRQGSSVDLRPVTLGPHNDTDIVIASGAEPGLAVDTLVQRVPAAATPASPAPAPTPPRQTALGAPAEGSW